MIRIIAVGRMKNRHLAELVSEYGRRILTMSPYEIVEIKDSSPEQEARRILARLGSLAGHELVIALEESGREFSSQDLAHLVGGHGSLTFLIGGPEGLAPSLRTRCDRQLRLSALTLTHEMARLLLCEQIYRALTIIRNKPYHRA